MLTVSEDFTEAEASDVNKPTAKVYLVLGNYATSAFGASASASGAAANYPASGAIDGDRTELNVGPASSADNDVGQSSWRSTVAPSTTPQTLTIDMGQSRTVNRIKLYHLSSHALSSYKIESSPDNSAYTLVNKTTDQGGTITTTNEVDTIDFSDTTCRYLKLTISGTVVGADMANVVEFEIYRLVDVSSRVLSVRVSQARDYQLNNSMPSTTSITLSNTDKFFSPGYGPLSSETDFINDELKPGIGLIVKYGFDYTGSQEYVQNFIGSIDKFTIKPIARTCVIEARDGMKVTFNKKVSTKLKTNTDLANLIIYLLNQANISTWETDVDTTGIVIDYFFTIEQTIIEGLRELVEASGDATFFFTEQGIATFRSYLNSTALNHTDTSQADFEAGTETNIDTTTEPGKLTLKWFKIDDFTDSNFTSDPVWTQIVNGAGNNTWAVVSQILTCPYDSGSGGLDVQHLTTPFTSVTGSWEIKLKGSNSSTTPRFYFMSSGVVYTGSSGRPLNNSYYVSYNSAGQLNLGKVVSGTDSNLGGTVSVTGDTNFHTIRVTRNSSGTIDVYFDGVFKLSVSDSSITTSSAVSCSVSQGSAGSPTASFDDIYWSPVVEASEVVAVDGEFVSETIDQGASVATEGVFQTTQIVPTNTTITWYTATSTDGMSWDPYVAVTPGAAIGSTVRRYLRYKAVLTTTSYLISPTITDVTVNWTIGTGSVKYPSSVSFTFDENLNMDLDQVYADTIAGGSSIVNSVAVKAEPLVLDGADTDVVWQGTTGTPPVDISVSNPLGVTSGQTLTYRIAVNGMDTSFMSGANPAAAAITFAGGGAGSWVFSSIHPTRPVLVITITGTGTITNLQVQGKVFNSDNTLLEATDSDTNSIQEFGERKAQLSNKYIVNSATAQSIATKIIENLSDVTTYTPQVKVRPTFSIQIGDRITLIDENLDIQEDNLVIGIEHNLSSSLTSADAHTILKLLKIPN